MIDSVNLICLQLPDILQHQQYLKAVDQRQGLGQAIKGFV